MEEVIKAKGHKNVLAMHKKTIEFTKEDFLTPRGDCIIAICADKALDDLSEGFKEKIRCGEKIKITIESGGFKEEVVGYGHPDLTLDNKTSMVIRKSDYICGRTLCIKADKAASELDRKLVENMKRDDGVKITLRVMD